MTNKDNQSADAAKLRKRAEERLKEKKKGRAVAPVRDESPNAHEVHRISEERVKEKMKTGGIFVAGQEMQQLFHELEVHQIELEMQNEELRRSQVELDAARTRYFDLYDLAPVGYVTVSEKGLILEANLTAAKLLGVARGALGTHLFSKFIFKEDENTYFLHHKQLFETGEPQVYEVRMLKKDGTSFWAYLETTVTEDDDAPVARVVLNDITEMKKAHEVLQIAFEQIRTLRGIIPICANCKKIRDDQGYWSQVEVYVRDHTEAEFSHSICPECVTKLYPEFKHDDGTAHGRE